MSDSPSRSRFGVLSHLSGSTILRGSLAGAARNLKRQLWLGPLMTAVILAGIGWALYHSVETSLHEKAADELRATLNADLAALEIWLDYQRDSARDAAANELLHQAVGALLAKVTDATTDAELLALPEQAAIRKLLDPTLKHRDYAGFILVDSTGRIVASFRDELTGKRIREFTQEADFVETTLAGNATVSRPMPSAVLLPDHRGRLRAGVPTMFACAPLLGENGKAIAALGLRIRPQEEFTEILNVARFGKSGETYAFDKNGLLLSSSRFDDQLKAIGLLPDTEDAESILTLRVRDPLVDLTRGERTPAGAEKPLTEMAAQATAGNDGVNVEGYRDYRGVPVVGAWRWLPEYGFGVATEVDYAEAFEVLGYLRLTFYVLFGLFVLAAIGMLLAMLLASRARLALKVATIESKRLGQYALEEKLGEGGMGVVYKARHAFLRRPTAVKMLHPSMSTEEAVRRFEREVQLTSQLTHPNTIAIFDYGRTEEGVFYYAMEFLNGISLESLVQRYGPQPDGRVIAILQQLCGSLAEAHACGLIHRDVKPANILLNRRGRMSDVVKVLDFGLVKSVDGAGGAGVTMARSIVGTPHYMPPEAIVAPDEVDARSDLYAVGAVGYFLLTGQNVFDAKSVMEVCQMHLNVAPEPPSKRAPMPISGELEAVLLRCLEKRKESRPQSAEELSDLLGRCAPVGPWSRQDAEAWWAQVTDASVTASVTLDTRPVVPETVLLPTQLAVRPGES